MTPKFTVFALFGQEGLKITKISYKAKILYSFRNIFTLLAIFEFWNLGSFLHDFLGPIFVFWLFGGQKFKKWKISKSMIFLVFNRRNFTFSKFFSFWIFDPQKAKNWKLAPENHSKLTQEFKIQNFQVKEKYCKNYTKFWLFMKFLWFSILLAQKEQKPWILESFLVIFSKRELKTQKSFIR